MPSNVALGIMQMQMQPAMIRVTPLLSMPACQGNDHIISEVYRCERCVLWRQIQHEEFVRVEEYRQH
jgi:hypothetical protein